MNLFSYLQHLCFQKCKRPVFFSYSRLICLFVLPSIHYSTLSLHSIRTANVYRTNIPLCHFSFLFPVFNQVVTTVGFIQDPNKANILSREIFLLVGIWTDWVGSHCLLSWQNTIAYLFKKRFVMLQSILRFLFTWKLFDILGGLNRLNLIERNNVYNHSYVQGWWANGSSLNCKFSTHFNAKSLGLLLSSIMSH